MLKQGLINEFLHEVENTRKLLHAIPNSALDWKPTEINWNTAQLASHIVKLYAWLDPVINQDEFALDNFEYNQGDISDISNIISKFEENVEKSKKVLENFDESTAANLWKMIIHGHEAIPPTPKIAIIRGVVFNHLYHHRGELVVYLRMTGNKVPGLYGPTADGIR